MSQGLALTQSLDKQYKGLVFHGGLVIKPRVTQEHWSGLPSPPPGDLSNPGIKPISPDWRADSLPTEPPGKPHHHTRIYLVHFLL